MKELYNDSDIVLSENGVGHQFGFRKKISDDGGIAIRIDESNEQAFVRDLLTNNKVQMPIIICPEMAISLSYTSTKYSMGTKIEITGNLDLLAYKLMGYAHVVVVKDVIADQLFGYNNSMCTEYRDVIREGNIIFHKGFDKENKTPYDPIYISLLYEDDIHDEEEFCG